MIRHSDELQKEGIERVAEFMCISARTAPKAKGIDNIVTGIVKEDTKNKIADEMESIGRAISDSNFIRDAKNVRDAKIVVLIGTKTEPIGLNCGMCKFSCNEVKDGKAICIFNLHDLGVAVGSAAGIAANFHIDNRVMYRVGIAAQRLNLLGDAKIIIGIPLSATGKNIFFDR